MITSGIEGLRRRVEKVETAAGVQSKPMPEVKIVFFLANGTVALTHREYEAYQKSGILPDGTEVSPYPDIEVVFRERKILLTPEEHAVFLQNGVIPRGR